jgi:hypothetical protein
MSNELRNPADNLNTNSDPVGGLGNGGCEVIGIGDPADDDGEEDGACDGFEEDVESAIEDCAYCAGIEGEVWDGKPFWERDNRGAVGCLPNRELSIRV